jgi:hypothetical protein
LRRCVLTFLWGWVIQLKMGLAVNDGCFTERDGSDGALNSDRNVGVLG